MDPYRASAKAVVKEYSHEGGLTEAEAEKRLERDGPNALPETEPASFTKLFLNQFKGYLVWLLILIGLFALGVGLSTGAQDQLVDAVIIFLIVLINATLGAYQDFKAERFAQTLSQELETEATVLRSGTAETINAKDVVIGDIYTLEEGVQVPADARIIEATNLTIDESMLTGESVPARKHARIIREEVPLAERRNLVFKGTFVRSGTAKCVTIAIGSNTEIGKIAKSTDQNKNSRFLAEVDTAAQQITKIALPLIAIALVIFRLRGNPWVDLIMLGSALIVGSIPEGLPAIVTFTLSLSSLDLSKKGTLVKRKSTLETLGSIDVLCTDKTGTLTENRMTVTDVHTFGGTELKKLPKKLADELELCSLLANEARNTHKGFIGGAEDVAIIDLYNHEGVDIITFREKHKIKHLEPFSSEKRRMHVELTNKHVYEKGAPDAILDELAFALAGSRQKFTVAKKKEVRAFLEQKSKEGKRLITLVRRDPKPTYLGTFALEDPPKQGTAQAVAELYGAGVQVKMITGDSIETAIAIAKECGFTDPKGISWKELKDLSDRELSKAVEECNIFARMSPKDKLKIVHALQANGHVVGITGDGVNDTPALKQADIGISMTQASDIAKDAADLIILDGDLTHLLEGVKSGRTIFDNVRKVINYLLTANLAEVIVVFSAALMGLVPFTAIQLLWVNFVTDIAPALALGADPAHPRIMKQQPAGADEKLIDREILLLTVFIGAQKVGFLLGMFLWSLHRTGDLVVAQTITFTWLVFSHIARIVAIRVDERMSLFANRWLLGAIVLPVALQLLIIYTPIATFFQVARISGFWWTMLIAATLASIGISALIAKGVDWYSRKYPAKGSPKARLHQRVVRAASDAAAVGAAAQKA